MTDYIQITIAVTQQEQKEILVALLADAGYEGFEETRDGLNAFISQNEYDPSALDALADKYQLTYQESIVKGINWNQAWESNFEPVLLDGFVSVRADFHSPASGVEHEIIITPKMSFGTGHHATTLMMMEQMKDIDFAGKTVFDFGTGTGILAILAEKMGAKKILALDHDPWSAENALENINRNRCSRVEVSLSSVLPDHGPFDIVLANINKNVILESMEALRNLAAGQSILLCSGLLTEDKKEIIEKAADFKLFPGKEMTKDNWICIRFITK